MKKLLNIYDYTTNRQYYDMCIESWMNGQYTQAREQFNAMPRQYRKEMVSHMILMEIEADVKIQLFFTNLL